MMENRTNGIYRISLDVTHRCNLKCRLCAAHVPAFPQPWHPELEFLLKEIDKIFELAPRLDRLVVAGGEPLLRSDLPEMMEYLLKYIDQIETRVEIITNGSIPISEKLAQVCQKYGKKMYYIVDDYGPQLSKQITAIEAALSSRGIPHEIRDYCVDLHCGGWVDFGDFTHKRTLEESKELFQRCALKKELNFCIKVFDGRIDPCAQSLHCMRLGLYDAPDEYVDLFDESTTMEEKREKILGWYSIETLRACQYCDGMCADSVRFQPAEQL